MGDSLNELRSSKLKWMSTSEARRHYACFDLALTAGCAGNRQQRTAPRLPSLDVTSWTDKTELFMEYPPLVAGQTVRFAVHLTRLDDFSALNAGRPSIEMTPESGGAAVTLPGSEPLRPGAFRVEGQAAAGRPLSLGTARQCARTHRSPRSRHRRRSSPTRRRRSPRRKSGPPRIPPRSRI